eukprot:TRINITY_DN5877_c0_g1_i2.p1 TRINITY_DN5877_c0_g1~~TRINITY_DN5877_c0_g1_i2.p1  ORF type:complete len:449 (-),score=82.50 TRINITY_DN5877_c0_g1_i2:127-1473(-)
MLIGVGRVAVDWDWTLEVIRNLGVAEKHPTSPSCKSEISASRDCIGFSRQGSFWGEQDKELCFYDEELKGHFHFLCFRSEQMDRFVSLLADHELHHDITEIFTTGGGAYKYAQLFKERLSITLQPVDELGVVIKGISWLVKRPIHQEMCWLGEQTTFQQGCPESECHYLDPGQDLFPFILVNIGSGVSIVKVEGVDKFERVSGSALGGGTYWGLCKLLCSDCKDFSQASCLAAAGDSSHVNLLVEDIYGGDYELPSGAKLSGSLVASFFAKAGRAEKQDAAPDILHALTTMVSQNICQIAYLNARLHSVSRIVFTGNFLRQNSLARQVIADNMRRVSTALQGRQSLDALFLQHEGYFGALGSFLHNVGEHHAVAMCKRPTDLSLACRDIDEESSSKSCCSALLSMRQHVFQRWSNMRLFGASDSPDTSPCSPLSKGPGNDSSNDKGRT